MTFQQDIASKHLNVYPIVKIVFNDGTVQCISTRKGDFVEVISEASELGWCSTYSGDEEILTETTQEICENLHGGGTWTQHQEGESVTYHFKPILLNIPAISESIDVETKKYRISSVTLNISDYEYDGKRFSDGLTDMSGNSIINAEIYIYYVSQSAETFADFQLVGHYIIRKFTQNDKQVNLICEDRSQAELHKDLPSISLGDGEEVPDKYKGKPIPMVYGAVDNSPLVIKKLDTGTGEGILECDSDISADILPDSIDTTNPLKIYKENLYIHVLKESENFSRDGWDYSISQQYEVFDNEIIFQATNNQVNSGVTIKSPLSDDAAEVRLQIKPDRHKLFQQEDTFPQENNPSVKWHYTATELNQEVVLETNYIFDPVFGGTQNIYVYRVVFNFPKPPSPFYEDYLNKFFINSTITINGITHSPTQTNEQYRMLINKQIENPLTNTPEIIHSTTEDLVLTNHDINHDEGWNTIARTSLEVYTTIGSADGFQANDGDSISCTQTILWNITQSKINYLYKGFINSDFFADVIGREGSDPKFMSVLANILTNELNLSIFDIENLIDNHNWENNNGDFKYQFTVDKKINSKKLIEEIAASSPYLPYFKDGKFNIMPIKWDYATASTIAIDTNNIIDYKYDRTPIEKVVTSCKVKHHYDYGLKDFTKETDWIYANDQLYDSEGSYSYSKEYYGIEDEQELIFETKYIRDTATANLLARYLLFTNCNQHNIFTVKLPLSYIILNIGDVIQFTKLIQGKKAFGENYTSNILRNGQLIFNKFMITAVKKTLEFVEIKCYQLHKLVAPNYVDPDEEEEEEEEEEEQPYIPLDIPFCMLPGYEEYAAYQEFLNSGSLDTAVQDNENQCNTLIEPLGFCLLPGDPPTPLTNITQAACEDDDGLWNLDNPPTYGCNLANSPTATNGGTFDYHVESICQYPPILGEFQFEPPESGITDYTWNENEVTQFNTAIPIQWTEPDNAGYSPTGGGTPGYIVYVALFDQAVPINYYSVSTTDILIPVVDLANEIAYDTPTEFKVMVTCENTDTLPQAVTCLHPDTGAPFTTFTVTVTSVEDDDTVIPDDDTVYDPFELIDTDIQSATLLSDSDAGEAFCKIKFEMKANSPHLTLDETDSHLSLRQIWYTASYSQNGNDLMDNFYNVGNNSRNFYVVHAYYKISLTGNVSEVTDGFLIEFVAEKTWGCPGIIASQGTTWGWMHHSTSYNEYTAPTELSNFMDSDENISRNFYYICHGETGNNSQGGIQGDFHPVGSEPYEDIDFPSSAIIIDGYRISDSHLDPPYLLQRTWWGVGAHYAIHNNLSGYTYNEGESPPYSGWLYVVLAPAVNPTLGMGGNHYPGWLLDPKYLLNLTYLRKMILLKLNAEPDAIISLRDELLNGIEWNDKNITLQGLLRLIGNSGQAGNGNFKIEDIDRLIERIDNS